METSTDITQYDNYSNFLKAKFLYFKSKKRGFSYRSCAIKINSTTSYLKNVIEGRKRIGLTRISKIATFFELDSFESHYFSFLVIRDLIEDERTRQYFDQILERFKAISHLRDESIELVPNWSGSIFGWLPFAILGLTKLSDFVDSDSWIRNKLYDGAKLTSEQIREAIKDLLNAKLIEKKGKKYVCTIPEEFSDRQIQMPDPFIEGPLVNMRAFTRKIWEMLEDQRNYRPNAFFQSFYALNDDDAETLRKTILRHQVEINKIIENSKSPTRVVLVTNGMFTLTK